MLTQTLTETITNNVLKHGKTNWRKFQETTPIIKAVFDSNF